MTCDSWFPCYPSDLIGDTAHLCNNDFGAYWRLLCWYYRKGPPPDDDDLLRNVMRVEGADWVRTKGIVMAFFYLQDGHWHQKRADAVIQERNIITAKKHAQTAAARAANPKHQSVTGVVTIPVTKDVTTVQPQLQPQLKPKLQPKPEKTGSGRFAPPSLEEVKLEAAKIGLPETEAAKFCSYYESNGWKVGRNPMKSWPAAMIHWRGNWQERSGHTGYKPSTGIPLTEEEQKKVDWLRACESAS